MDAISWPLVRCQDWITTRVGPNLFQVYYNSPDCRLLLPKLRKAKRVTSLAVARRWFAMTCVLERAVLVTGGYHDDTHVAVSRVDIYDVQT